MSFFVGKGKNSGEVEADETEKGGTGRRAFRLRAASRCVTVKMLKRRPHGSTRTPLIGKWECKAAYILPVHFVSPCTLCRESQKAGSDFPSRILNTGSFPPETRTHWYWSIHTILQVQRAHGGSSLGFLGFVGPRVGPPFKSGPGCLQRSSEPSSEPQEDRASGCLTTSSIRFPATLEEPVSQGLRPVWQLPFLNPGPCVAETIAFTGSRCSRSNKGHAKVLYRSDSSTNPAPPSGRLLPAHLRSRPPLSSGRSAPETRARITPPISWPRPLLKAPNERPQTPCSSRPSKAPPPTSRCNQ